MGYQHLISEGGDCSEIKNGNRLYLRKTAGYMVSVQMREAKRLQALRFLSNPNKTVSFGTEST